MAASSSFTAHPESICTLGGQFTTAAQSLAGPVDQFTGSAFEVGEAFGLLGACDDAMQQYTSMAQSTQASLEKLLQVLQQGGTLLQKQGTHYELIDNTVAGQMRKVRPGASA